MSAGSFKQDSLGWRINLIKQRCSEWIEYQLSQLNFAREPDVDPASLKLLWQVVKFCLWSIIAVLLVWMTWQLWQLLRPYWRRWQRERYPIVPPSPTANLSATDWVERSQSARIEGNYRQAIFCLYQAMLKLLDERGIISFEPSLTDEEYRRSLVDAVAARRDSVASRRRRRSEPSALRGDPQDRAASLLKTQISSSPYELLLSIHQRLCFSNAEADRALFEQCQQAYKQIETSAS